MNGIIPSVSAVPIRHPCPAGACTCERERLEAPNADGRILLLTREEEKRLLDRLEHIQSLADLEHLCQKLEDQLGVRLEISPGHTEVRTMRGITVLVHPQIGLCRKTRQSIPAAIRRGLEARPDIAWALLNANDLLRDT